MHNLLACSHHLAAVQAGRQRRCGPVYSKRRCGTRMLPCAHQMALLSRRVGTRQSQLKGRQLGPTPATQTLSSTGAAQAWHMLEFKSRAVQTPDVW